jgi:DNA polymerase IV
MSSERQILHVDLDAFFVSVERVLNPDLNGKPVIVGGDPDGRGVVSCASYEARAYGVHAAMPLKQAMRLCPDAVFIRGKFDRYREASARFMAILGEFTPLVEPMGLDEAYLDLTGFEPLYGPVRETAMRIKSKVHSELGVTASIGIATSKLVAKIASDLKKPDGLVVVAPGEEREFLAPLPIEKMPFAGPKTREALKPLGVKTIGDLAALSPSVLKSRLGSHGEALQQYARGIDDREVEPPQEAKSISRETTFAEDTLDIAFLKATLRYQSERVGAELRCGGRRARCVTLKLRYSDFETVSRSRTLKETFADDQTLFDVGAELLDKALAQRKRPVRLVGIGVSGLAGGERQLSMLDESAERREQLTQAIDKLRQRYGFSSIQRGDTLKLTKMHDE